MSALVGMRLLRNRAESVAWNGPKQRICLDFLTGTIHHDLSSSPLLMDDVPVMARCSSLWAVHSRRYSSYKIIFEEPDRPVDAVSPHIRTCLNLSNLAKDDATFRDHQEHHSDFHIAFLGTGGGQPSTRRLPTGTLLHLGGMSFLFDAGEGIQRQLMFSHFRFREIDKIFITHLHGDHVLGLISIILALNLAVQARKQPLHLHVYGPPGLYNYIAANVALSMASLHPDKMIVTIAELVGGRTERPSPQNNDTRSIFHSDYPEIRNRCLVKESIECNSDGTWTIQSREGITKDMLRGNMSVERSHRRQLYIAAAEVKHIRGVQTFGFVVQEPEPLRNIDASKAIELGVERKKFNALKLGFTVTNEDGSREVRPEEVLLKKTKKARKVAVLGDNCHVPQEMKGLCQDADVLVQEATLLNEARSSARERGHSTGKMAGSVAKSVNARVLVLNHISNALPEYSLMDTLVAEARAANDGVSQVIPSYDFMELCVPREGFNFDGVAQSEGDDGTEGVRGFRYWWNKIWQQ